MTRFLNLALLAVIFLPAEGHHWITGVALIGLLLRKAAQFLWALVPAKSENHELPSAETVGNEIGFHKASKYVALDAMVSELPVKTNLKILDLGSGPGWDLPHYHYMGASSVLLVDKSEACLDQAWTRYESLVNRVHRESQKNPGGLPLFDLETLCLDLSDPHAWEYLRDHGPFQVICVNFALQYLAPTLTAMQYFLHQCQLLLEENGVLVGVLLCFNTICKQLARSPTFGVEYHQQDTFTFEVLPKSRWFPFARDGPGLDYIFGVKGFRPVRERLLPFGLIEEVAAQEELTLKLSRRLGALFDLPKYRLEKPVWKGKSGAQILFSLHRAFGFQKVS